MKHPGEKEQRAIRARAAQKMKQGREALEELDYPELYRAFLDEFAIVEMGYKSLLKDYLKASGKNVADAGLTMNSRQIKRVLAFAGVDFSQIDEVFNGKNAKGSRMARGLRNSLAHAPNKEALEELSQKREVLFGAMTEFEAAIDCDENEESLEEKV